MSKQEFILALLKEARAWIAAAAPFLSAILAWLLPSPMTIYKHRQDQLKKDEPSK